MRLANTVLRISTGALMAGHGLQKLTKMFGGGGIAGTASSFESMGFKPGRRYAGIAGLTETLGGAMLVAGCHTPLAASMITGVESVAIAKVHAPKGVWSSRGGLEYNLVLIAVVFALTETGPGRFAVDGLLTRRRSGTRWALAELALGLGVAGFTLRLANRSADGPNHGSRSSHGPPKSRSSGTLLAED